MQAYDACMIKLFKGQKEDPTLFRVSPTCYLFREVPVLFPYTIMCSSRIEMVFNNRHLASICTGCTPQVQEEYRKDVLEKKAAP
jgi:hypothetical protein